MRRKKHDGHHGGAWKVAYADFVTALMAFFIVLWLTSQSDAVQKAVAMYFRDPLGVSDKNRQVKSDIQESTKAAGSGHSSAIIDFGGGSKANDPKAVQDAVSSVKAKIPLNPDLKGLEDFIQIENTGDGVRIQLVDQSSEGTFFEPGSSGLRGPAKALLQAIAQGLAGHDVVVAVEGHTDSKPLRGKGGYSNWELSADRANATRAALEGGGIRRDQVDRVVGYADRLPMNPDRPEDAANRRISLVVRMRQAQTDEEKKAKPAAPPPASAPAAPTPPAAAPGAAPAPKQGGTAGPTK